jgi:hypothetical protein
LDARFSEGCVNIGGGPDEPVISTPAVLAFALGAAFGYGVWAAAPALISRQVPWEGSWPYYSAALITASALVALLVPRRYAAVFVGAALGQIFAKLILLSPDQRLFLTSQLDWIGVLFTLPGTWLGSKLRDPIVRAD